METFKAMGLFGRDDAQDPHLLMPLGRTYEKTGEGRLRSGSMRSGPERFFRRQTGAPDRVAGLATALGFVAFFAPGGVGVREGVLIEGLSRSGIPLQPAVLGSVALRAVWLLAELATSAALYYGHRPSPPPTPTSDSPD